MKRFLKWTGLALVVLLVAGGLLFANVWYFKPLSINAYYARTFVQFGLRNPELMTSLRVFEPFGIRGHNARLTDASPEAAANDLAWWKAQYEVFKRYDREDYNGQALLSYDIWDNYVGTTLAGLGRWRLYTFPVNSLRGVQSELPNFMMQQHSIEDELGAKHYVERFNAFDTKFDEVIESMIERREAGIHPPAFSVREVIDQIDVFLEPSPEDHPLVANFDERLAAIDVFDLGDASRAELRAEVVRAVDEVVYPTYRKLRAYMVDLATVATSNDGVWRLPDGDAYYQFAIAEQTTTTLTADEIHAIGLAEVKRLGEEIDIILEAEGLTEGSIGDRLREIARRPDQLYPDTAEGRQQMLADYQAIIDEIDPAMDEYFNLRPTIGVEVQQVPEFSEATAAFAYYQSPSLDGQRPGVFFANLRDLSQAPRYNMRTVAYHEAIPGHHFQLTITQELEGLPIFRRLVPYNAYVEGWALYTEQLAWELGFLEDRLDNLGRLNLEMFRAARLVVDSGMHAKRWSREQGIEYMLEHTGLGEVDVTAEVERYLLLPGQALGYKVGMIKILELRERARTALGDDFDIREFHDQVLGNGGMPLTLLEQLVDDWISERQAAEI